MPEPFDPYRKWLGIPPAEQPANHYRLLGIAVFEEDPDVIAHAADRQMSHVRKLQSGQNGAHAQKLLSELANARRCLLAAEERRPYDAQLKKQLGVPTNGRTPVAPQPARTPPVPAPPAVKTPEPPAPVAPPQPEPPVAADVPKAQPFGKREPTVAVHSRPVSSVARRGRRRSSAMPMVAALCALAGLAAVGLIVVLATMSELEEEPSTSGNPPLNVTTTPVQQPNTGPPKPPGQNNPRPQPPQDNPERDPVMPEEGIGSGSDLPDDGNTPAVAADSPKRRAEFEQAATAAEKALASRDMTMAAEQLAIADSLKFSIDESKQIANLQIAQERLAQFWTAVDSGLKLLKSGDEVGFGGVISNFVSTQDESVTLLITGNRKTERMSDLAPYYLVAIAQRGLSRSDPVAKLVLATFLAVDQRDASPENLEQARALYSEAVADGERCEFLADRLAAKDEEPALPKPGDSGGTEPDMPQDPLGTSELPAEFPDPDETLPKPGAEPEVGPAADAP